MKSILQAEQTVQKPKKSYFIEYIRNRLLNLNQNFIGLIQGQTGSGKSWSSIGLSMAIDQQFAMENIVFNVRDFITFIKDRAYKGAAIVFEEAGVGLHNLNFWSDSNKGANKVLQTFRHKNLAVIFNSPEGSFIDSQSMKLFHCIMNTAGIDRKNRYCQLQFHFIKPNYYKKNQPYRNPLRVYNKTTRAWENCTDLRIKAPPDKVIQEYEKRKREYTAELNRLESTRLAQKQ